MQLPLNSVRRSTSIFPHPPPSSLLLPLLLHQQISRSSASTNPPPRRCACDDGVAEDILIALHVHEHVRQTRPHRARRARQSTPCPREGRFSSRDGAGGGAESVGGLAGTGAVISNPISSSLNADLVSTAVPYRSYLFLSFSLFSVFPLAFPCVSLPLATQAWRDVSTRNKNNG